MPVRKRPEQGDTRIFKAERKKKEGIITRLERELQESLQWAAFFQKKYIEANARAGSAERRAVELRTENDRLNLRNTELVQENAHFKNKAEELEMGHRLADGIMQFYGKKIG